MFLRPLYSMVSAERPGGVRGHWHAPGFIAYISTNVHVSKEPLSGTSQPGPLPPNRECCDPLPPRVPWAGGMTNLENIPQTQTQYFFVFLADTPIEEFTPTPAFPALQYLESVDEGGVAWQAGLRTGDFLIEVGHRCLYHTTWGERRLSCERGLWF